MSKSLVINNETYTFPDNRDSAGWGTDVTAWSVAVTDTLNRIIPSGDIISSSALINNGASATPITDLFFDPTLVRGIIIEFTIYRVTTGAGAQEKVETGTAYISYKPVAATFDFSVVGSSGSGVTLSIDNTGQVKYTSDSMTGSSYSGKINFRARVFKT